MPYSEDQAVAIFKLADARFRLGDFAGAVSKYNQLLEQFDKLPAVTNEPCSPRRSIRALRPT